MNSLLWLIPVENTGTLHIPNLQAHAVRIILRKWEANVKALVSVWASMYKSQNDELMQRGWSHTATIDPCKWIEYLFNETEPEDIIAGVRELSTASMRSKVAV